MPEQTQEVVVTGAEVAGLFVSDLEESLTPEERAILASLLNRDDRVDLVIPDAMSQRDLWMTLDICSRVFLRVGYARGQLKLLIGRALLVIQDTPEVFTSRGFSSFDQFMSDCERGLPHITGISRPELYKAKRVAGSVGPSMNLDDARQVGFGKLQLIAGVTEAGSAEQNRLIAVAKTSTIPELREHIARSDMGIEKDDLEYDVLQLLMTKTQKRFIQSFLDNPQVSAYCGSESAAVKLELAVQEAIGEWQIQALTLEGVT